MIKHVIAWTLKATEPQEKSAAFTAIAEGLGGLPHVIPELKTLHVGQDLAETEGNWDVVAIMDFESTAGLAVYQAHPEHQKVATVIRSHTTGRTVVDYEF
jgi:hypothetical protein